MGTRGDDPVVREAEITDLLREVYAHLHQNPELGHQEFATADYIEAFLDTRTNFRTMRPTPTSVVAMDVATGPALVLRADMDALPLQEHHTAQLRSCRSGVMHACGHDGHMAALAVTAERLSRLPARQRTILVFQHAEEVNPSGAPALAEWLRGTLGTDCAASRVVGFHVWPDLPSDTVGIRPGPVFGSVNGIRVDVHGARGAKHGNNAQADGRDALEAAVSIVNALGTLRRRRHLSFQHRDALHIGQLTAGERPQDVATHAEIVGTLRALDWDAETRLVEQIGEVARVIAALHGCTVTLTGDPLIRPPLVNDGGVAAEVVTAARAVGVECDAAYPVGPVGVSDDFGWYTQIAPSAYFFLGCGGEASLHDERFSLNPKALVPAVKILTQMARHSSPTELNNAEG